MEFYFCMILLLDLSKSLNHLTTINLSPLFTNFPNDAICNPSLANIAVTSSIAEGATASINPPLVCGSHKINLSLSERSWEL